MLNKPIIIELANNVYAINEFGLSTMFLVVGSKKAAIIDTGVGTIDLLKIVRTITDLPLVVLLTHAHRDHCGGIDQYDSIYLNSNDVYKIDEATLEGRIDYLHKMSQIENYKNVFEVNENNVRKWNLIPKINNLTDGMVFDLGDRIIKTIFTPGHSKGSCCFIDNKSKILFSGDALNQHLMVTDCSIQTELESLLKLKQYENEFTQNFNGHVGYGADMNHTSQPKNLLDDTIVLLKQIMNNKASILEILPSKRYNNEMVATAFYKNIWITYRVNYVFNN